jgi:hypothetical protein
MRLVSKLSVLAPVFFLAGCRPPADNDDTAYLNKDQLDTLNDIFNKPSWEREASRQAESAAEASAIQTGLLVAILVVLAGILIAVLVSKSKRKDD